jgi:chromatin segregation and condensation protein Rec8/ScpA/Scc1 (kleisin family)
MTEARHLESELESAFETASLAPQQVNLSAEWERFERFLEDLPHYDRLKLAGLLIAYLANLYEVKASRLLEAWEDAFHPQDPTFSEDWLKGLVRQEQQVDLSLFTKPNRRRSKSPAHDPDPEDSVVATVDKSKMLEMLDQMSLEEAAQKAVSTAHDENVSDWNAEILTWFHQHHRSEISLKELQQSLNMPLIQLWLALLLGQYQLQQRGDFYSLDSIWVSLTG